jgi:hypothetical protein
MTYLCWAAMYEGETDAAYFDVLIPRLMEDIVMDRGLRESTIPASPAVRLKRGGGVEKPRQTRQAAESHVCRDNLRLRGRGRAHR